MKKQIKCEYQEIGGLEGRRSNKIEIITTVAWDFLNMGLPDIM